jgi:hypothetical protein
MSRCGSRAATGSRGALWGTRDPMPETTEQGLFPAEHRGLRELYAAARHLAVHWDRLAARLEGDQRAALTRGAAGGRELLVELAARTSARGLQGRPAASGVGSRLAGLRDAGDLLLERNQAMRAAVLDVQHAVTLLAYLATLAEERTDIELAGWERAWHDRLAVVEEDARAAAVALGHDPDGAILPAGPSRLGRAGHSVANGFGTLGETIDNSPVGRIARRLTLRV